MKEFFLKRYKQERPDFDIDACQISKAIRINTLKITEKDLKLRLKKEGVKLTKIEDLKYGYTFEAKFSLGSTPEYLQGYYYLQEKASQIVAEKLNPQPGEIVLDMAAAPGSKTTHMAQLMENKGTIVALDNNTHRLHSLRNNLERCGVTNTILYNKDARYVTDFRQKFDKVLLDAPCSGNFCIDKNWFEKRTLEDIKNNGKTQKQLLRAAEMVLKEGGTMIYSTCSLEPEEDENVVEWALEELDLELIEQKKYWPDVEKTQGFFIALLRKIPSKD